MAERDSKEHGDFLQYEEVDGEAPTHAETVQMDEDDRSPREGTEMSGLQTRSDIELIKDDE